MKRMSEDKKEDVCASKKWRGHEGEDWTEDEKMGVEKVFSAWGLNMQEGIKDAVNWSNVI